jgi:hypothetical protein
MVEQLWGGSLHWRHLDSYDPCIYKFQSVRCFEGRIFYITTSELGWTGQIPKSFGLMPRLTYLDLGGNQFVCHNCQQLVEAPQFVLTM